MRPHTMSLALALALSFCCACGGGKPVYEYKTIDRTNEPRVLTADGKNAVIKEQTEQGWELTDPEQAKGKRPMVFRRERR